MLLHHSAVAWPSERRASLKLLLMTQATKLKLKGWIYYDSVLVVMLYFNSLDGGDTLTWATHREERSGCGASGSHRWCRWSECCCWPEPDWDRRKSKSVTAPSFTDKRPGPGLQGTGPLVIMLREPLVKLGLQENPKSQLKGTLDCH